MSYLSLVDAVGYQNCWHASPKINSSQILKNQKSPLSQEIVDDMTPLCFKTLIFLNLKLFVSLSPWYRQCIILTFKSQNIFVKALIFTS